MAQIQQKGLTRACLVQLPAVFSWSAEDLMACLLEDGDNGLEFPAIGVTNNAGGIDLGRV